MEARGERERERMKEGTVLSSGEDLWVVKVPV